MFKMKIENMHSYLDEIKSRIFIKIINNLIE